MSDDLISFFCLSLDFTVLGKCLGVLLFFVFCLLVVGGSKKDRFFVTIPRVATGKQTSGSPR